MPILKLATWKLRRRAKLPAQSAASALMAGCKGRQDRLPVQLKSGPATIAAKSGQLKLKRTPLICHERAR
jgi:hypothetical protein